MEIQSPGFQAPFSKRPFPLCLIALALLAALAGCATPGGGKNGCVAFQSPSDPPFSYNPAPPPAGPPKTLSHTYNVVWNTSGCATQPKLTSGKLTVKLMAGGTAYYTGTGNLLAQPSTSGLNSQTVQITFSMATSTKTGNFTQARSITANFSGVTVTYP